MGVLRATVQDVGIETEVKDVRYIQGVQEVHIRSGDLSAKLDDKLTHEACIVASREIRLLYGFCFNAAFSEDFQVKLAGSGFHHTGRNQHKQELISRSINLGAADKQQGIELFVDILHAERVKKTGIDPFDFMQLWLECRELLRLGYYYQARLCALELVDLMGYGAEQSAIDQLKKETGIASSDAHQFALQLVVASGRSELNVRRVELAAFAKLFKVREGLKSTSITARSLHEKKLNQKLEDTVMIILLYARAYTAWLSGVEQYVLSSSAGRVQITKHATKLR